MKQKQPARQPVRTSLPIKPSAANPAVMPQKHAAIDRLLRIERRKARNKAVALSIFVLAIMLVTVLLIIAVMQQAKPQPRLQFIQNGDLAHTIVSTGLVIRDEVVFSAPSAGLLKPLASEGARAAKGQKLALVIPADREGDLKELQKCENDIIDLQTELMQSGKGTGAQAIFDEGAASLGAVISLIRGDIGNGDLSKLNGYATSIAVILEQRTARLAAIDFNDSRLDKLLQTKASLENSLGLASGTLICEKPGIVSFKLDGLESVLNQEAATVLTVSDFNGYVAQAAAHSLENQQVSENEPVLRVSASLYQNLVFCLPADQAALFQIDKFTSIQVPEEGITIEDCRIIRSDVVTGKDLSIVVFRTDRKVDWLDDRRTVQAKLTLSTTSGMKVPMSALIKYDQTAKTASLMIVQGGYTRICKVTVVDSDKEDAIIQAVASETYKPVVSTVIVTNPESIKEDEFIGD